jgi:two-component system sensor histidine kinase HydH
MIRVAIEKILANALGQDVSKLAVQEKRQLLSRLLARFAHEVRNPLSSLDIHVQLLEEDFQELPPPLREKSISRFEIIHGELHRLENIVKHFLSLSGPSSLELQTVQLGRIVGHVCDLLRPEAAARDIEILVNVPADLPSLQADPSQLTQALVNLVINAIQAIERNGRVEVGADHDTTATCVRLRIKDSGPGIPAGREFTLFEPFFTTKPEGSGLGLWIVQQIVTAHGGEVEAATAAEGGAEFTLQLPLPPGGEPPRG